MKILFYSGILLLLLLIWQACQPRAAVKQETYPLPDSTLYYQQADINDPFLDTVFLEPDKPVTLSHTLYPVIIPEQPPRFREAEGFRVQVFAGADSLRALSVRNEVSGQVKDSVHYFSDKGLYKVQVGDYLYRYLADNMKTDMRQSGFTGAWVVQRNIIVPFDSSMVQSVEKADTVKTASDNLTGAYKIQIMATGAQSKAEETITGLKEHTSYRAFYEFDGNLYRVFVGLFEEESVARQELENLRAAGYNDAWLVY
jgi:hypothetical protein